MIDKRQRQRDKRDKGIETKSKDKGTKETKITRDKRQRHRRDKRIETKSKDKETKETN